MVGKKELTTMVAKGMCEVRAKDKRCVLLCASTDFERLGRTETKLSKACKSLKTSWRDEDFSWIAGDAVQNYELGVYWDPSRRARGALPAVRYVDSEDSWNKENSQKLVYCASHETSWLATRTCSRRSLRHVQPEQKTAWHAWRPGSIVSDNTFEMSFC